MRISKMLRVAADIYHDSKGKKLTPEDINWIKKCAKEMNIRRWESIAARPKQSSALLANKGDLKKALSAFWEAAGLAWDREV